MAENQNQFNEHMNQGHNAAWDQDWQNAAGHYRRALEEKPDHPKALVSLGLALFELGLYDQSIEYYSQAVEVAPDDPLAYEKTSQLHEILGQNHEVVSPALYASELYLKQGNIPKSIECLVRVIRVDPENLPAHSRLALTYERTGRKRQSVNEYLMVASIFQHKGEIPNAQQALDHALKVLPESKEIKEAQAILEAGHRLPIPVSVNIEKPDNQPAVVESKIEAESSQVESDLDPIEEAHQAAISALANLVLEQDINGYHSSDAALAPKDQDTRDDRISSQSELMAGDRSTRHLKQAVLLWNQNSRGAAADELEKAMQLGLDHPAAYFELGSVRSGENRMESAIRQLQHATQDPEYALAAKLLIARNLRYMDKLSEAATGYLEALGLADAQLVPPDQSEDMLRMYAPIIEAEAKQTDPQVKNQLCDLVDKLLIRPGWRTYITQARGDFQIDLEGVPAIPIGELISNPQGNRIVESVAQINQYARSGYWRSAMETAFFAIQFAPTYLPLHTYMGELLLKQDHLSEAVEKFGAIAKTYHARGEPRHAIKILKRLINAAPMDLTARMQLISLQEEIGLYEDAVEEKVKLAGVYYTLADLSHAREIYLEAYKIAQDYGGNRDLKVKILNHLADIELQSLDWRQAEEIYAQIRSLKPDDSQASERLIDIKLRMGQDAEAEDEIEEYIAYLKISDNQDAILTLLDHFVDEYPERVFLRMKKAETNQEFGQTAIAIQEYDAVGDLLLEAGNRQGAVEVIEKIIALDPADIAQYEELISTLRSEK